MCPIQPGLQAQRDVQYWGMSSSDGAQSAPGSQTHMQELVNTVSRTALRYTMAVCSLAGQAHRNGNGIDRVGFVPGFVAMPSECRARVLSMDSAESEPPACTLHMTS